VKRSIRIGPAVLFVLALVAWPACPAGAADAGAIARSTEIIERERARTLAPGAQIAVSRGGRLVWSRSFGCANVELDVPVDSQTRFRIGSVSKPLTAAAIGALVQDGKLDLDVPVQTYVPDFPKKAWPITTRQLAGHVAGIRHYEGEEFAIREHYDTVRAGLAIFEKDALLFEPGTKFSYSSYGWNLIAAVIESASGEPFLAFMQKRVFTPAGMAHTSPDEVAPIIPGRSRFYTRDEKTGRVENAPYVDNSYKWAGGGFLSTAEDLVTFANSLLEGRLLRPETVTLLWTSMKTSDGKETDYGIGWSVDRDHKGRRRVRHSGGAMGGTANLVIYPEERLVVALLVNSDESFTSKAPGIAEIFADEQNVEEKR
jgi:serine beta-lactamase-like protein LACTB, mitochondrial